MLKNGTVNVTSDMIEKSVTDPGLIAFYKRFSFMCAIMPDAHVKEILFKAYDSK